MFLTWIWKTRWRYLIWLNVFMCFLFFTGGLYNDISFHFHYRFYWAECRCKRETPTERETWTRALCKSWIKNTSGLSYCHGCSLNDFVAFTAIFILLRPDFFLYCFIQWFKAIAVFRQFAIVYICFVAFCTIVLCINRERHSQHNWCWANDNISIHKKRNMVPSND